MSNHPFSTLPAMPIGPQERVDCGCRARDAHECWVAQQSPDRRAGGWMDASCGCSCHHDTYDPELEAKLDDMREQGDE